MAAVSIRVHRLKGLLPRADASVWRPDRESLTRGFIWHDSYR